MADKKDFIGLIDRERDKHFWLMSEIMGHSLKGQYVPNTGDFVLDRIQGWFEVTSVDYLTGKSVLTPWKAPTVSNGTDDTGLMLSTGPGKVTESFRLFVDKSVTPYVAAPCGRLYIHSSEVAYYKLFLGTDTGETGRVISFVHDTSGKILGSSVPFKKAIGTIDGREIATWQTTPCLTTEDLKDNEIVTMASYTNDGLLRDTSVLVVQNTGATRQLDDARRYVSGIQLRSPYISTSQPDVIEFPVNVPVEQLPMECLVHYSDGKSETHALDSQRVKLLGTDNYTATNAGDVFDLVLTYMLGDGEVSYNQRPTSDRKISHTYKAVTTDAEGAYSVKLFAYPVWNTQYNQYYLVYWLYNLDRQTFYDVTSLVEQGSNSNPFDPNRYSTVQTITVAVDLDKVNSQFKPYRHVQTFQVVLMSRGSENKANWAVKFRPDQTASFGGGGIEARFKQLNTNDWEVNIANGATSKETWIQKLYYDVEPLFNTSLEARAPAPTHFRLRFLRNNYEYPVSQWDQTFNVVNDLAQGELLYIEWLYRTDNTDLQLAITGLPVHNYTTT